MVNREKGSQYFKTKPVSVYRFFFNHSNLFTLLAKPTIPSITHSGTFLRFPNVKTIYMDFV